MIGQMKIYIVVDWSDNVMHAKARASSASHADRAQSYAKQEKQAILRPILRHYALANQRSLAQSPTQTFKPKNVCVGG